MSIAAADVVTDEIVPIKRVARSLNLSVQTIINMTDRGDFAPRFPIKTRKWLYRRSDLDAFWRARLGGQNGSRFPLAPEDPDDEPRRGRK